MKSRRLLKGLLALFFVLQADAGAEEATLSPLLRYAREQGPGVLREPSAMGPAAAGPSDPVVRLKLRLRPGASAEAVAARHPAVRISSPEGRIATAALPFSALAALAADPAVEHLEERRKQRPLLNVVRSTTTFSSRFIGSVIGADANFGANLGQNV